MMKGRVWGVEAILFIASLALCVVAALAYVKRDDGQAEVVKELIRQNLEINARIHSLETREDVSPEPQVLNVHLKDPVSVNVVYTEREAKVPPQIEGKKSKTPLMDRARKAN